QVRLADIMLGNTDRRQRGKSRKCTCRPRITEGRLIGAWVRRDEPRRPRRRESNIRGAIRRIAHNISERGRADRRHIVVKPERAANGCFPSSCRVVSEPDAGAEVLERRVSPRKWRRSTPPGIAANTCEG